MELLSPDQQVGRRLQMTPSGGRLSWARRCLWLTLFLPIAYSVPRTSDQIGRGFELYDIIRGGGALILVTVAVALAPVCRRGVGVVEWAAAAYCGVALASTLWSINPTATASKAVLLAVAYFAVFRLVRLYASTAETLSTLAAVVHALLFWCLLQAILFPDRALVRGTVDTTPRLTSVVPSIAANPLAFMALGGIVAVVLNIGPRLLRNIPARVLLACVYMAELTMTRTRTALILGIAVLLLTVLINFRRRPFLATYVFLIGIMGVLLALTVYAQEVASYLLRGQSATALRTLTGRTDVWNAAWQVIVEHPLTGLGFYSGHRLGIPFLNVYQDRANLDNTWIEALVDVGLFGTIPLALMLIAAWFRTARAYDEPIAFRVWALALLTYAVSISAVNPTVQSGLGMNWILTLIPAAAFIRATRENANDSNPSVGRPRSA